MVGQSQLVLVEGVSVPGRELSSPLAGQEALGLYTAIVTSAFPSHFPRTILGLQDCIFTLKQTASFFQSTELSTGGWDRLEMCLWPRTELVQALKRWLWGVGVNAAALAIGLCYMACLTMWNVDFNTGNGAQLIPEAVKPSTESELLPCR